VPKTIHHQQQREKDMEQLEQLRPWTDPLYLKIKAGQLGENDGYDGKQL
jgi:hypothetical protein